MVTINKKFREIADKIDLSEGIREQILQAMGIENFGSNPSREMVDIFGSICESIKNGTPHEEAITNCLKDRELAETKKEDSEIISDQKTIGEVSQEIGRQTGRQIAGIIPPLQKQGCSEVVENFNAGLIEGFQQVLEDISFTEAMQDFSTMDIEDLRQGKLKSGSNNAALPQGNSESSPEVLS